MLGVRDICLVVLVLQYNVAAYSPLPRWGQATVMVNDALFIHGGMTDQFNQFSYTSAQTNDDIIYLPLTSSFNTSSPPWQLVNSSASRPAVAWHTLAAFSTSEVLLFGGLPGPNSATVVFGQPDSAVLLDVSNPLVPQWTAEAASWANEPMRRIRHSTSSTGGKIYLIGGEKADGSNIDFSDHYVFDINGPSFTLLPSNGPPALSGHTSLVLSNGQFIVFGGFSGSQAALLPFTTIWALDTTQSTLSWMSLAISNGSVPNPRRAFAAVVLQDGKVLIHGGADAHLQNSFSDGWILDTTQNPMVWSQVDALTQLGPRRDHFAAASGTQVIFGFGYGNSSGADATLQVFDTSSGSWTNSFTPPAMPTTNTLPPPTQTTGLGGSSVRGSSSVTNTGADTATSGNAHPTSTVGPGTSNSPSPGDNSANDKINHTRTLAVGTTFGVFGLIATGLAAVYLVKKRDGRVDRFRVIGGEDGLPGDDNESIPNLGGVTQTAGVTQESRSGWLPRSSLPTLGLGILTGKNIRTAQERRDMLADEDTRQFNLGSFYNRSVGSSWSLKSVGAMMWGIRSREASASSTPRAGTPWREKSDPFSDGPALARDEEIGLVGAGAGASAVLLGADGWRPPAREQSYSSALSGRSYIDPFAESISEEPRRPLGEREGGDPNELTKLANPHSMHPPPIQTMFPLSTNVHTLSPLTEGASINTLMLTDPSISSDEHPASPFDTSSRGASSYTSLDTPKAANRAHPFRSSIIDANPPPAQPMIRSNSWWTRFSRTAFLDRKTSDSKPHSRILDIRDPNPPPRLVAIEESMHSQSPDSPQGQNVRSGSGSQKPRQNAHLYSGTHGKSVSSLQTTKTADSEAIERMGGTMVVVQRDMSGSHRMSASNLSTSSTGGRATPDVLVGQVTFLADEQGTLTVASPKDMTPTESLPSPVGSKSPGQSRKSSAAETPSLEHGSSADSSPSSGKRPPPSGGVAARIRAYERRLSQDTTPPSPEGRNTKHREERTKKVITINYGLAPRQSLYVANPDHGGTPSDS